MTDDSPDPAGAELSHFEDGRPDGNFACGALVFGALNRIEPYASYDRKTGAMELAEEWAAKGWTTLEVVGVVEAADWSMLRALAGMPGFPPRTRNYL
ncbi:MAG: hypothetical protein ACR2PF_05900 [Rhizobiaceae bacterium]